MPKTGATSYKQTKYGILPRSEVVKLEAKGTEKGLRLLATYASQKQGITSDLN